MPVEFSRQYGETQFFFISRDGFPQGIVEDYNKNDANVSPSDAPAVISNKPVSPSGITILIMVLVYIFFLFHEEV